MGDSDPETVVEQSPEVHFEPVIKLEKIEAKTHEENEKVLFESRAKMFRFCKEEKDWKERGTGKVRILEDKEKNKKRVVMRREKTLKLCANHVIEPNMKLSPSLGSDRSWTWTTAADCSDKDPAPMVFAIRFAKPEIALDFRQAFLSEPSQSAGSVESHQEQ